MTRFLLKHFATEPDESSSEYREQVGVLGGWVGLLTNILLFLVKLISGLVSGSISITTDAMNNLSDSSSSLITIVGVKLSGMPADEEHPYGHARFEYISGLLVACLIFMIGIQFLINSVKKIFNPQPIEFTWLIGGLLVASILVKLWQGRFYYRLGKKIDSSILLATAVDSRNDVLITLVILISSVVQYFTGWLLDGYMGLLVSLFVIYSSIELLRDTLTPLIGAAPDKALVSFINEKVLSYPTVMGLHDLMIHNYGHDRVFVTVHVELPAHQDILVSHEIIDEMERDFLRLHNIHLLVHIDPIITDDPELDQWQKRITQIIKEIDPVLSMHDFRIAKGKTHTDIIFEMTVPPQFATKNASIRQQVQKAVTAIDSETSVVITIDRSYISSIGTV